MSSAPCSQIVCAPLPHFDESSLEAVRAAFQNRSPVELGQSWFPQLEPEFRPTAVRIGWRDEALFVLAELQDDDIFSRATGLNQRTWELGDVFEIFLRPVQQLPYVEFHITPNNQRLQLRFPSYEALVAAQDTDIFTPYFREGDIIESSVWVQPEQKRWYAFARIPSTTVYDHPLPLSGEEWYFSFCRYEYRRDCDVPVLSSSSSHHGEEPDFHVQADWNMMVFEAM